MGVVSHSYVGLGEGRDGYGGYYMIVGQNMEWLVACWQMPELFPNAR